MDAPVCACHDELMTWQSDKRRSSGGRWVCRAKRREYNQRRSVQRVAWMRQNRLNSPRDEITARRCRLRKQRALIVQQLHALEQEAEALAQS